MNRFEDGASSPDDVDPSIMEAATDPYVSFVSQHVVRGVVEHPHVAPDWVQPRLSHIKGKFRMNKEAALEAINLSEKLARQHGEA